MTNLLRSRSSRWILAILVLLIVAGAAWYGGRATSPSSRTPLAAASGPRSDVSGPLGEQARREDDDPLALGPVDAPVALVIFSDYRCPFCARYSRVTEPELVERFVDDGRLRIEWRDVPVFGEPSMLAARAGRAAAAQGRLWEFNRAVYEAAPNAVTTNSRRGNCATSRSRRASRTWSASRPR